MSASSPTVSVIVPNYNHGRYLPKRLESIFAQTLQPTEVIILDDCSTDNSRDVIERYRSHPLVRHIVFNEVNSGSTFAQWQKGLELAQGEWVWIAESDDWCEPTLLHTLLEPVMGRPDATLSYCQSVFVNEEGAITHRTFAQHLSTIQDGKELAEKEFTWHNIVVNASMAIFRKEAALSVPDDYRSMRFCGDWAFWTALSLQGAVHISGKYLNYYLRHGTTVASSASPQGLDFLEGTRIFNYIQSSIPLSKRAETSALRAWAHLYFDRKELLLPETREAVKASVLSMHPRMPRIFALVAFYRFGSATFKAARKSLRPS